MERRIQANWKSNKMLKRIRLNLGCGQDIKKNYINIDIYPFKGVSYIGDIRWLPFPDNCVDEILAIHVIESFYRWELEDVFKEWFGVIKKGGFLDVEFTDLDKCVKQYQKSDKNNPFSSARCGFYGGQKEEILYVLNYHKYVWRKKEIVQLVKKVGFKKIKEVKNLQHHPNRDVRLIVIK